MPSMSGGGGSLPFIRLLMTATQAILTGTNTKMTFDTIQYQEGFSLVAPVTDIVVPANGFYVIHEHDCDWADQAITIATGRRALGRQLNSDATKTRMGSLITARGGSALNQTVQSVSEGIYLTTSDILNILVRHEAGSTLNVAINSVTIEARRLVSVSGAIGG